MTPPKHLSEVVLLGTSGGPRWWSDRAGISTAIVAGDRWYLVDCGSGLGPQIRRAGLELGALAGVFVTHLHSDHIADLMGLLTFGMFEIGTPTAPIPVVGRRSRRTDPAVTPRHHRPWGDLP